MARKPQRLRYVAYWSHKGRTITRRVARVYPKVWDAAHNQMVVPITLDEYVNPPKQVSFQFMPLLVKSGLPDQWIDAAGNLRNSTGQIVFNA